jgi:integrase
VGTTKNDDGREVDLTDELRGMLTAQVGRVGATTLRAGGQRRAPVLGEPMRDFRRAWATACKAAGVPGLLKHDLRRSAVRRLVNGAYRSGWL